MKRLLRILESRVLAVTPLVVIITLVVILLSGCRRHEVIAYPDGPILITDPKGSAIAYSWSEEANSLIKIGKINLGDFEGWTLTKFDWSKANE